MAIGDRIGGLSQIMGNAFIIMVLTLAVCSVIVGLVYFWMKRKRFKHYTVLIFKRKRDKEGRETLVFAGIDKGAIIKDRKLKKRIFKLKKNNVHLGEEESITYDENRNLDIPSIPSEKGGEIVFLEKLGPKKFSVGTPFLVEGQVKVIVSEADVAEAIRAYDINAKYYGGREWTKWIGPISFAVFAVLIVILISVLLQKFEILREVGDRLVQAAQIVQTRSSTIPTNVPG